MISINWLTRVISVPQSELTLVSGSLYSLDVDQFRLSLKDIEDNFEGMTFPDTHRHNTQVTLSGVTYARTLEIINGYTVEFENTGTPYTITCIGANHNLADVTTFDGGASLIIGNSAGLISVTSGSGVTAQDKLDIADAVWDEMVADHVTAGTTGKKVKDVLTTPKFIALK